MRTRPEASDGSSSTIRMRIEFIIPFSSASQFPRQRAQLELRLDDGTDQLEPRGRGLELSAPRIEQLEQRTAAQTVGGFRHFEECRLTLEDVLFEPVQRDATQLQRFEVALILGAQRRACRALARPGGGGVGQRLVFERALAVENRDLAREPD